MLMGVVVEYCQFVWEKGQKTGDQIIQALKPWLGDRSRLASLVGGF
jgi:hypothetical protein